MLRQLFMPSTPLNVLISAAVALRFPEAEKQIWLIDQRNCRSNPYYDALLAWQESPFTEVEIFCAEAEGLRAKMHERQRNFTALQIELDKFQPDAIAVGSDRRVEFQFAMAHLHKQGQHPKGIYLDDGLYSYAGRSSNCYKDGLNSLLKKIAYGLWWEEPRNVGTSSLIDEAWLFRPSQAIDGLQSKRCVELKGDWFADSRLSSFSQVLAGGLGVECNRLAELDVLVMVPHPNNLEKMVGRTEQIRNYVRSLAAQGKRVGVKYHPRSPNEDFLSLMASGAQVIIPSQLAFEFVLPMLSAGCHVIADVGTVLLTTKWLRPDMDVTAILDSADPFQQRFIDLFEAMDVSVVKRYPDSSD